MDPNAALAYLNRHADRAATLDDDGEPIDEFDDLRERAHAIAEWIRSGGFAPNWKAYPAGTEAFHAITGMRAFDHGGERDTCDEDYA